MALKENVDLLTPEERAKIAELKPFYNRVKETRNELVVSTMRVEVSRKYAGLLLKASLVLNILSIFIILTAGIIFYFKPSPDYYASTPSGKLYGPLSKADINKL